MIKAKELAKKSIKKAIEKVVVLDANRTSCTIIFQPKMPAKIEKYKKTNV